MTTPPGPARPRPIRPVLVDVTDPRVTAPEMFLAWPGRPTLWNRVRIRAALHSPTKHEARQRAAEELAGFTREQLQLLREVAEPGPEYRSEEAARMLFEWDRAARAPR